MIAVIIVKIVLTPLGASGVTLFGVIGMAAKLVHGEMDGIVATAKGTIVPVGIGELAGIRRRALPLALAPIKDGSQRTQTHGPMATTRGPRQSMTTNGPHELDAAIEEFSKQLPGRMVELLETEVTITKEAAAETGAMERGVIVTESHGVAGRTSTAVASAPKAADTAASQEAAGALQRSLLYPLSLERMPTTLEVLQGRLVLYQNLTGKAWISAEELSLPRLGSNDGVSYLVSWINARFLDLEVARIGRAFSDFFRRLRRRQGQTIREYNTEYDRLHARLREVGCSIPEECAAWLYLDRLQLEESQELNLLASVGNSYSLHRLQQAAVLHDRGQRKPWETTKGRRAHTAHVTDTADGTVSEGDGSELEDGVPEDVAVAYATYQTAKEKYKEQNKARGYYGDRGAGDKGKAKGNDASRDEKIRLMKSKSYCNSCGKKGHWHKDPECPNNGPGQSVRDVEVCHHVPLEVYAVRHDGRGLVGITDTACAKSVAGTAWLQNYSNEISRVYQKPELVREHEAFRFGTGKVHHSSFHVVLYFEMGGQVIELKASIINGDVPLLLSKDSLAQLGMVYDVAANRADFRALGLKGFGLITTTSGHPAIPIIPARPGEGAGRLVIADRQAPSDVQYTAFAVSTTSLKSQGPPKSGPRFSTSSPNSPPTSSPNQAVNYKIFYDKKLSPEAKNILTQDRLHEQSFISWWEGSKVSTDMLLSSIADTRITDMASQCKPPAISSMTKAQLLQECERVGLVVHRTWTVEEIKAVIQEYRMTNAASQPGHQMKSITSLNLPELRIKADELGVEYNHTTTKGNLLRLIRDSLSTPGTELMKIGKYKGFEFQEVPRGYAEWASREVKASSNPHPELVRFARWWDNSQERAYVEERTIEANSVIPFPDSETDTSAWGNWSEWGRESPKKQTPAKGASKGYSRNTDLMLPRTNKRGSSSQAESAMDAEGDPETIAEIEALEQKLAALKDKAKVTAKAVPKDHSEDTALRSDGKANTNGGAPPGDLPRLHVRFDEHAELLSPRPPRRGLCDYEREGSHFGSKTFVHKDGCCGKEDDVLFHEAFISQEEFAKALASKHTNYACATTTQDNQDEFARAYQDNDFTYDKLLDLLNQAGLREVRTERDGVIGKTGKAATYHTLGLYTHGGTFGITTRTKEQSAMARYINEFGKRHLGKGATWTSVTIAFNTETDVHHDFHNLKGTYNHAVSFGQESGGGLWIENKEINEGNLEASTVKWRQDKAGRWMPGRVADNKEKFVTFDPFLKHATEPWVGGRWCLVYHSTRNYTKVNDVLHGYLKKCGFPLPRRNGAAPGDATRRKPCVSTRKKIFNNAAKVGVLMATLLTAASSYLANHVFPDPIVEPIVIFEIGGTAGTEEAVSLGKDVFEPMDWATYQSPEGKETAYHVINGGAPRELRVNLFGKKDACNRPVLELMQQQINEGGTVVVKGSSQDTIYDEELFKYLRDNYTQYNGNEHGEETYILYRACERSEKMPGPTRCHQVCVVDRSGEGDGLAHDVAYDGTGITFGETTPPMIASALRRLHQNLGHPQNCDLIRHLRLAGCDEPVIKAARGLRCQVCEANAAPRIARPSVIPQLCDWNDTVGIDLFYAHDINDVKHTFLSAVDYGTTYHLAVKVDGQSAEDIEAKFNEMWIVPFGPPKSVVVDLDGGVQGALGRLCDWHNIAMKSIAAQSHWQAGMIERQQAWWKNIWERLVYELTIGEDEAEIAAPIINSAKNDLRRRCGHSPSQWVFGRAPRIPEDLQDPDGGNHVTWDVSEDSRFQRQAAMRAASRVAFHRSQTVVSAKRSCKGHWTGPAVIVGKEGNNYWISSNGRCRLTSPEHIRGSTPEEVGAYLSMKGTQREVEKLLEFDPDGDEAFEEDPEDVEVGEDDEIGDMELDHDEDLVLEPALVDEDLPMPTRRLKRKTNMTQLDETANEAMILKSDLTRRGVEKRKEKELKWTEIPEEVREKFHDAERVQWEEHLSYDALEPLTTEASDEVRARVAPERILRCRWAYKDKNWARRREGDAEAPWRCKSRLVIAGHTDPDLGNEHLSTDAPTLSRSGLACLLQLTANGLAQKDRWELSAGDIRCAFLTGSYLSRELFMHQPRTGFPGMSPGQLVRIKKNVFGLATSPHEWWGDLQAGFREVKIQGEDGNEYRFDQCPLDPCIFMLRRWNNEEFIGSPIAYVGCHVDDLLVAGPRSVRKKIEEALSVVFPIESWEEEEFEFLGSQIKVGQEAIQVVQEKYATTRLFKLEIPTDAKDEEVASDELACDNRSLIGALSWMAGQSRPDLTCAVSMAQQLQKQPTVGDLRFTNATASKALQFKSQGLVFRPVALERLMLVIYHDAAWANVPEADPYEDYYVLTPEDDLAGLQTEGPYVNKSDGRKAKKGSSKVASQLGVLVTFTDRGALNNEPGNFSIADWKSRAGQRVCRSTFGAETQACAEGLETGQYIRSMLETLVKGPLVTVEQATTPLLCLSDCRSLYDHLNRQGVPRVPTDKRLAVDLAALRQALRAEMWCEDLPIAWIPGAVQKGQVSFASRNWRKRSMRDGVFPFELCYDKSDLPESQNPVLPSQIKVDHLFIAAAGNDGKDVDVSNMAAWEHDMSAWEFEVVDLDVRLKKLPRVMSICISQSDPGLKTDAILSLAGLLKNSDRMLILWDPTWTERLWCLFELAAFLKSKKTQQQHLIVRPIFMGPLSISVFLTFGAIATSIATVPVEDERTVVTLLATIAFSAFVAAFPTASTIRRYFRDLDTMKLQLSSISVDSTRSTCCDFNHLTPSGEPMLCDRKIVKECLNIWFGSESNFEDTVRTEVLRILNRDLTEKVFSTPWALGVTSPSSFWLSWMSLQAGLKSTISLIRCGIILFGDLVALRPGDEGSLDTFAPAWAAETKKYLP
ncbi:RE2 [Symbiodinium sp. CCMP2592]|nr:RE2 [Symbiodinium sp. CCMP2592]